VPSSQEPARRDLEAERVAASGTGLVLCSADWYALQMTQQKRANPAMGDDYYVSVCGRHGYDVIHGSHDSALSVDGSLPSADRFAGPREKLIRDGFKLHFWKIPGCGSIVLAEVSNNDRRERQVISHYMRGVSGLSLRTGEDCPHQTDPRLVKHEPHALNTLG